MKDTTRISELFEELSVVKVMQEATLGHLAHFINDWKAQMGREVDKIVAADEVYWNRITEIYESQREKGIKEYGQPIEENNLLSLRTRMDMLEEELVDGLVYIEHLKEGLGGTK